MAWEHEHAGSASPATRAFAVTPNDSADLTHPCRAFYVGVSGDVKVTTLEGDTVTFVGVAAGVPHPIWCTRIFSTSTTATSIVAIY